MAAWVIRVALAAWFLVAFERQVGAEQTTAPTPARIEKAGEEVVLGKHLSLAYDPTAAASFEEVRSGNFPFAANAKESPNLGYRHGAEWARVEIRDDRTETRDPLVLEYGYASTDELDVIAVKASGETVAYRAGDHVPHAAWPIRSRLPAFELPDHTHEIFVRVAGAASHQLPLLLSSKSTWYERTARESLILAVYYGALGAMLVYNLLVWAAVGLQLYGNYVLFLAGYGGFSLFYNGTLYATVFGNHHWLNDRLLVVMIAVLTTAALRFMLGLLDLGERRDSFARNAARLSNVLNAWAALSLVLPYSLGVRLMLALLGISVVFLMRAGVWAVKRGERSGRWYVLAWSLFFGGIVANLLRHFGAVPTNPLTANLHQVGSAAEFLLLSFALADRIKQLQAEATANAELAAANARAAESASMAALAEQERANSQLQRVDKLKDEFLANTSHELRTPLHGILGLSEAVLASDPRLAPSSRERLELVVASGRRLASLVNDILDFSKLRHQEIRLREKTLELAEACRLAVTVAQPLVGNKDLKLVQEVEANVFVRADENRLQQILTNLIGNAVKFTPAGEVRLRAELREGRVFVAVIDTGIGIAESARERVFESFEQADGSTSREFGGTGLGLAVTKKLVELHGGTISVTSELGRGSTFTFDLATAEPSESAAVAPGAVVAKDERGSMLLRAAPLASPSHESQPVPDDSLVSVGKPHAGTLLVADDDPVNVEVLRAQLEPEGYTVRVARDGREAVDAIAAGDVFDGVLLDVMMPRMTGPEAATRIREDHPHGTLPILMLTAKNRAEDAVTGMRAGASDYIGKPFHREELLHRLDAHIQTVRTARAFRRFVPEDFLELLGVDRFESLVAGLGQRHEVTVLFTDVRNFTARSEKLGPEGTFRFINGCLETFEPIVRANGGFVDKFIGDAIMAIFPRSSSDAMRAAIALHAAVTQFNAARPNQQIPLAIGVGIHRGPVVLGTVGGPERLEVTAIGDAVNVAARLESLTKPLGAGTLISEDALGSERGSVRRVGAVRVKGRQAPVELFEVLAAITDSEERAQKAASDERFQRGLRSYAQADIHRALEHFEAASVAAPRDQVVALYVERCRALAASGVPATFAGDLDSV
jgi:signal transduction histidine kinase/class 3 adenylate cyclase